MTMRLIDLATTLEREALAAVARGDAVVFFRVVRDADGSIVAVAIRDQAHPPSRGDWAAWQLDELHTGGG